MYIIFRETHAKMQKERKGLSFAGTQLLSLTDYSYQQTLLFGKVTGKCAEETRCFHTQNRNIKSRVRIVCQFTLHSVYNLIFPFSPFFLSSPSFIFFQFCLCMSWAPVWARAMTETCSALHFSLHIDLCFRTGCCHYGPCQISEGKERGKAYT